LNFSAGKSAASFQSVKNIKPKTPLLSLLPGSTRYTGKSGTIDFSHGVRGALPPAFSEELQPFIL
jgi:hypothetical protein